MEIKCKLKPFPHIIIDNLLDERELQEVIVEMKQIISNNPEGMRTGEAVDEYGMSRKKGFGLFIDDIFVDDRLNSNILNSFTKVFCPEIIKSCEKMGKKDHLYNIYEKSNLDRTLMQWYTDGHYYKPHQDLCIFTVITLIQLKKRRKFKGGELQFIEYDYEINLKHNQTIIFPSLVKHQVFPVKLDSNDVTDSRVTITKFIHYDTITCKHNRSILNMTVQNTSIN